MGCSCNGTEVLALATSDSVSCEADHTELLQASSGKRVNPDTSPAGLKDLAERLVKAKQEQGGWEGLGRAGKGSVVGDGSIFARPGIQRG